MDNFNMDTQQIIGYILLASPFVAVTILGGKMIGWLEILCVWLLVIGVVTVLSFGLYLITN